MVKTIKSININNSHERKFDIKWPEGCTYCHQSTSFDFNYSNYIELSVGEAIIFAYFLCSRCTNMMLCKYHYYSDGPDYTENIILEQTLPKSNYIHEFDKNIKIMFPEFCQIYNEAYYAEQHGLYKICGLGYRKALEFLIKDHAIKSHPNNEEQIKNANLSTCINNYINDPQLKSLAKASAWLGNDETHYVRKIENYGINELKSFILAIAAFINAEIEVIKTKNILNA